MSQLSLALDVSALGELTPRSTTALGLELVGFVLVLGYFFFFGGGSFLAVLHTVSVSRTC